MSLRTRVLYLAALFALLLVGAVTLTTYFLITDGMTNVAEDTVWRLAGSASRALANATTRVKLDAAGAGLAGDEREREARRELFRLVPDLFAIGSAEEGAYVLYDENLEIQWFSDPSAVNEYDEARRQAVERRQPLQSGPAHHDPFAGLFEPADLGVYVVHLPLDLPDTGGGVLDVVYYPAREEAVIDSVRSPMLTVAAGAIIVAVIMMQLIMGWTLSLVKNLKTAAESVDAGQLDVQLPVEGQNEVSDLARSLNDLIERLRRRGEVQTRFVADASHELATPVAGIRGYVNILRSWGEKDPDVRKEAISAIDRESRRMARLCSDLLSVIRSDEALTMKPARYDINALAREVLATAATRYFDKKLEFVGPEEGPLALVGDRDQIEQALSILVDNSAKYTPQGGEVSLTTRRYRENIIVEVSDTGIGVAEEDLPYIFERFYRSDLSRSQETGGFGLGLSIAKRIVEAAGGTISVRSQEGKGTTFTIILPRGKVS